VQWSLAERGLADIAPGHPLLEGWLAVPIVSREGANLGLIQVADKIDGDFTTDDEMVLLQLAQLAAVAIGNAERYAQEHLIAETLQRSMLPRGLPRIPGLALATRYMPGGGGTRVGGDWYDTVVMDDGRVMLAVGDVVGHGPQAAAIMGQLRTAMRAYALQQMPATVLMRSLDILLQDVAEQAIATAACVMLDPGQGTLETVLAGHPPPIIVEPTGQTRFVKADAHVPMGVREAPLFLSTLTPFEQGSTMLMFTDGLVESRSRPLEEGLEALAKTLTGLGDGVDVESLCDAVLNSMVPDSQADDIALLAVRRLEPPGG
jgi:serine phosphatase RsbU (regulator of sigma subunit)